MKCPKVETMCLDGAEIPGSVNFGGARSQLYGATGPFLWCAELVLTARGLVALCFLGSDEQICLRETTIIFTCGGAKNKKDAPKGALHAKLVPKKGSVASATPVRLGAGHLAGLEAVGAHVHLLALAIDHAVHALDVGTELTVGHAVGVADGATSNGVLTADFANFGHIETLLGRSGTTHLIKQIGTIAQNTGNASNLHEQIPAFCPRTCYAYR